MIATHWALGTWERSVHQYIALTKYVRNQLIAGHFPEDRIAIKPNFVMAPDHTTSPARPSDYFIYVGRLSKEKGLKVLLDAWMLRSTTGRLKLVGCGPLPDGLPVPTSVEILGEKPISETYRLIAGAKALILPALWAEPFGRVVIEAFALGTPVISSSAGSLPELVDHNVTGLVVESGSASALAGAIDRLSMDAGLCATLSMRAREAYVDSYSEQANYRKLIAIYKRAVAISASMK